MLTHLRRRLSPPSTRGGPLAQSLRIEQRGSVLALELRLRADAVVHGLWWHFADLDLWWQLPLPELIEHTMNGQVYRVEIDLRQQPELLDGQGASGVCYLDVEHRSLSSDAARLATSAMIAKQDGRPPRVRHRMRFGQFALTDVGTLSTLPAADGQPETTPYVSKGGYLAVLIDRPLKSFTDVHVARIGVRGGRLRMSGRLAARHEDLESAELLLKGRTTDLRLSRQVQIRPDPRRTRRDSGLNWYRFSVTGDFGQLLDDEAFADDIYDLWFVLTSRRQPEPFTSRVGKTRFFVRWLTRPGWMVGRHQAAAITPYYTFKARRTSFQVDRFDKDAMVSLRRAIRWRHLTRLLALRSQARPLWLVGERPNKAQDTGLAFFRYLRAHHPEVDAYYVIDPTSADYAGVEPLGNVLAHRSVEHVRASLRAQRVLGSHHPDFVYPLRTRRFRRAARATRIFLQHGVMGTKWMVPNYGKGTGDFTTDLFCVSSEREKEYIVSDFGYTEDEVAVTGLSRFDDLFADDVERSRALLIMPTWRDWLQDADEYPQSEYHQRWSELLHHPRLHELAQRFGFEIVLCLHPNMHQFANLFEDAPVRVLTAGGVDIQHLLKSSTMLVTDYSSVGFDFSFLHRPVVYYQFDQSQFLGARGSHLDLDAELPGPIVFHASHLLNEIEAAATTDFQMTQENVARADRFISHRDRSNNDRIFEAVRRSHRRRAPWRRVAWRRRWHTSDPRLNRQRYWLSLMRLMFRVVRRLPVDNNLVVFESGVGKQYADSPRYIYEELRRRCPDVRVVWAFRGKLYDKHERTIVVDRLSPAYFYYLARARYWVNNQNFPHYIKRRSNGIYLQTWHGTPLKRMLHDLDVVYGRDSGYLARVSTASAQWSSLVSPSPFATSVLRSAFRYGGDVLELGYPRNDLLFGEQRAAIAAAARRRLGVARDKRVVLYAPTFRDDQSLGRSRFGFNLPIDLERFHAELGDDVVLLLRMHVLVRSAIDIPTHLREFVVDASDYAEIQELYLASDALVTDYSSVFFDYANLGRPMFFYAYDLESYRDQLRGFYLDYETTVPGPVVTTETELLDALAALGDSSTCSPDRLTEFVARFSPQDDGQAAARIVDRIFRDLL